MNSLFGETQITVTRELAGEDNWPKKDPERKTNGEIVFLSATDTKIPWQAPAFLFKGKISVKKGEMIGLYGYSF